MNNTEDIKLNEDLIKRQGLSDDTVTAIKEIHKKLHLVKTQPHTVEDPVKMIESLEYTLQLLWGFAPDASYHNHWLEIDGCLCPRLDNYDSLGHHRYINNGCPWHGGEK